MSSVKAKFILLLLTIGLLSACGTQATQALASQPTDEVLLAAVATDTAVAIVENTATSEPVAGATVSFSADILPIFESRCVNCHGGNRTEEGLILKTHSDILAGSKNRAVVVPGDAGNSLLAELVANQKMPKRGPKLTPPQVQLIVDWINQGALDN